MKRAIFAVLGLAAATLLIMGGVGCGSPGADPSIWTDKTDYQPEETVTIFGAGFSPGPVALTVTRPDGEVNDIPDVSADSSGSFTATYQLDGIMGTYTVRATDSAGQTAQTTFRDTIHVQTVSVGSQTGSLTEGTAGSASYTISTTWGGGGTSATAVLGVLSSWSPTAPEGVTTGFVPSWVRAD